MCWPAPLNTGGLSEGRRLTRGGAYRSTGRECARKAPSDAQGTGGAAVTTTAHRTAKAEHTNCAGGHGPIPNVGGYRGGGGATSGGGSK